MATEICKYCDKKYPPGCYKIILSATAEFLNDTYNRYILRDKHSRLYNYDVLCFYCQAEINTYLREHPELRKTLVDSDTYYNIVDSTIDRRQLTQAPQEEIQTIRLYLRFDGDQQEPVVTSADFYRYHTLRYVIEQFHKLESLPISYNLVLVGIRSGGRSRKATAHDPKISLRALDVDNDGWLYFEPLNRSSPTITVIVYGPSQESSISISCERTDNINDLLTESIKRFDLYSIPRECIQLRCESHKITNEQLYQTFDELKIKQYSIFFIHVDQHSQNVAVKKDSVTATVSKHSPTADVNEDGATASIDKYRSTTDLNKDNPVLNENHIPIAEVDTGSSTADTQQKPTEPIVITETPPSLPVKEEANHVYVDCDFAGTVPFQLTASVSDTLGELIAKIAELKEDQSRVNFSLRLNGVRLDTEHSDRHLSDLGVKPGDLISAYTRRITSTSRPISLSIETKSIVRQGANLKTSIDLRRHDPIGLRNLGNTCFMNSILQCLSHVAPLRNFFLDFMRRAQIDTYFLNPFDSCGPVTGAFAEVIWELCNENSYAFEPTRLKRVTGECVPRFATFDQQDAPEFMIFLLDAINKELAASHKSDQDASTIIKDLFHGTMKTKMTCLECRQEKETLNTIGFLPLPLSQRERIFTVTFAPMNGSPDETTYVPVINNGLIKHVVVNFVEQRPSVSLDQVIVVALRTDNELSFDTPLSDVLENELLFLEQESEDHKGHEKPTALSPENFPKNLLHCFEEFLTLEMLDDPWFCHGKCNRSTKAAKILELQSLPPVLIIQLKRFAHKKGIRRKLDTLVEFPLDELDLKQFLPSDTPKEKTIYDLVAVANHMGSIHGGHYTAYVRQENETDQWYHISDSSVSQISSSNIVSRDAYLLVYLRCDQKTKT